MRPGLLAVLTTIAALLAAVPAFGLPRNPADRLASLPIDGYRYDHAEGCKRRPARGTVALQAWKISDTLAHRDHIHFGLSRAGARMRTTFWKRAAQ